MISISGWTYGAEHEFVDWDRRKGIPEGFGIDLSDRTMVNSNGIAVDSRWDFWPFGGEIQTPPTESPEGQGEALKTFLEYHPDAKVNYRSNLHIHVRVPGLAYHLPSLKKLLQFNFEHLSTILPLVDPIPIPRSSDYENPLFFEGAKKRYRRRLRSHHTLPAKRNVTRQLDAMNLDDFFRGEVPQKINKEPLWVGRARSAVNLRQLRDTETVEFRHFPGTLDVEELLTCIEWCRDYLLMGLGFLNESPVERFQSRFASRPWPKFGNYQHDLEVKYQATLYKGKHSRDEIQKYIGLILAGSFNGSPYYE